MFIKLPAESLKVKLTLVWMRGSRWCRLWICCRLSALLALIHTHSLSALLSFALTHFLLLCCLCQWWRLSWVPSRHVAVVTGVKGRMKEQAPSPSPRHTHTTLPLTVPPPLYLCGSTGSLTSAHSAICHPFVALALGRKAPLMRSTLPPSPPKLMISGFLLHTPAARRQMKARWEYRRWHLICFRDPSQTAAAQMHIYDVLCVYECVLNRATERGFPVS